MNTAIIVCGTPGAGKTTYANKLAAERHATVLDIDTCSERLVRLALAESGHDPDDRDSPYFKQTYREPIYQALFDIAEQNLAATDVIIVGPFTREIHDPLWPQDLSHKLGAAVEVHYVQCPPEIRRERLARRGDDRDLAKLDDWDNYLQYYGEEQPPAFDYVLIDGNNGST